MTRLIEKDEDGSYTIVIEEVSSVSVKDLQKFLRYKLDTEYYDRYQKEDSFEKEIKEYFSWDDKKYRQAFQVLVQEELVAPIDGNSWEVTEYGLAPANAHGNKYPLRQAEEEIDELLRRIEENNESSDYSYLIAYATLIGSVAAKRKRVGDADIVFWLEPNPKGRTKTYGDVIKELTQGLETVQILIGEYTSDHIFGEPCVSLIDYGKVSDWKQKREEANKKLRETKNIKGRGT